MQPSGGKPISSSKIWILALLCLSVIVAGGLFAYHFVFRRPGEAAASLIPADATMVATLDLTPGPDQVVLFGRLAKSLTAEQESIESTLAMSKNGTTFYDEIVPHLRASYAMGMWQRPGAKPADEPAIVGLAAVDSPATAESIAAKHGVLAHLGSLAYYNIKSEKICIAFIQSYLVVSNSPDALARVQAVSRGETAAVTTVGSFQAARTSLPASANLMMFGNMSSATDWSKKFGDTMAMLGAGPPRKSPTPAPLHKLSGWATFAATLRNQGLETSWRAPYDSSLPGAKLIGSIVPIDKKLYNRLPAGPYGFLALAQPGAYYGAKDDSLGLSPDEKKGLEDGLKSFEKETGLDIRKDLLPGLNGNLTLAVYPAREAMTGFPDGLILLDDANGADPATMLTKIKAVVIAEYQKNKATPPTFTSTQKDGAVVWALDEKSQDGLRKGVGLDSKPEMPGSAAVSQARGGNGADGMPGMGLTSTSPSGPAEKKKLLFATVGRSVYIASSESLMNRAIAAYNTGSGTLETDPAYMPLLKQIVPGAQNVFVVAVPDVMARLKPVMAPQFNDPQGPKVDDIVKLFGTRGNGLVSSQGHEDQTLTGSMFVPLDYETAIHLMSLANQATKQKTHSGAVPPSGW